MWIKRSDLEIKQFLDKQERKTRSLLRPAVYGLLWGTMVTLLYSLGYRGGSRGFYIFAQPQALDLITLILAIGIGIVAFAMVLYRQRRGRTFFADTNDTRLCSQCWQPSSRPDNICDCGGQLDPYEYYSWVEPAEPDRDLADMGVKV